MVYFVLLSALVFIPTTSTFVDALRVPPLAYLSILAAVCMVDIRETPLLKPWVFYLGAVAVSGLAAPNFGMFVSRFSLDTVGAILFWYFAGGRYWPNERKVGWFAVAVASVAVGLYWFGWLREVERVSGIVVMACLLVPGVSIAGLAVLGMLRRRVDFAALLTVVTSLKYGRQAFLAACLGMSVGALWSSGDLSGRLVTWGAGLSLVPSHPIGVGRGNLPIFLYPFAPYLYPLHRIKMIWSFLDNDYLDLLVEAGPVALVSYVWLLVSIFRQIPRTAWQSALYASMLTFVLRGLFHSVMISPAELAWFWALAGIYWRVRHVENDLLTPSRHLRYIKPVPLEGRGCVSPQAAPSSG